MLGISKLVTWDELKIFGMTAMIVSVQIIYEGKSPIVSVPKPDTEDRFRADFLQLLVEQDSADVTFLVKSEKILAHKLVLSARSPYFKAMFASGMKESVDNEIEIPDVEPEVFKELLKFLYSDSIPDFRRDICLGLLVASEKYGLGGLKKLCEAELSSRLTVDNVIESLLLAEDHNCSDLLLQASVVFRSNVSHLALKGDLNRLERSPSLLVKLLKFGY